MSQHLKWIFFYCVLTRMMKEVFSPCPPGMLVLFCGRGWDPDFVFLLRLLFPWREEPSEGSYEWSTLPLFSKFSGDLKLLKVWGWVTAQRCLCDAYQACAYCATVCYRARTCMHAWVQPCSLSEGIGSMFSDTCYSYGQSFLLTHDISPRLISFSCRGRQDQTNVVWNSSGSAGRRGGGAGWGQGWEVACLKDEVRDGNGEKENQSSSQQRAMQWHGIAMEGVTQTNTPFNNCSFLWARWLCVEVVLGKGREGEGSAALFLHDASEYPCKE